MESKIIQEKPNPFLHRHEYVVEIQSNSNPTFGEIKQAVGKDAELSVVRKVHSNFGRKTFTADVFVYDNQENMEKVELKKKVKGEEGTSAHPTSQFTPSDSTGDSQGANRSPTQGTSTQEEAKSEEKPAEEVKEVKE